MKTVSSVNCGMNSYASAATSVSGLLLCGISSADAAISAFSIISLIRREAIILIDQNRRLSAPA